MSIKENFLRFDEADLRSSLVRQFRALVLVEEDAAKDSHVVHMEQQDAT